MLRINNYQKIFGSYFLVAVLGLWSYIQLSGSTGENAGKINFWYSFLFGLIPFFAGLIGMVKSKQWGGLNSVLGKAIFFFSLGLFLWGFGENIWSYYNFFKSEPAPYPSIADIGFAPSIFFWIVGTVFFAKASGAWFALKRNSWAKALVAIIFPLLILLSYHMLVRVARGGVLVPEGETTLKVILDIAYPLGDFVALTFASLVLLLSRKYLGGIYRWAIVFVLLGLGTMYFGDFGFSYTTTTGSFYNANWSDLLLASGNFLMSFGILAFASNPGAGKSVSIEGEA